MSENFSSKEVTVVGIICATIIVVVSVMGFKSYQSGKIEANKVILQAQIDSDRTIKQADIVEHQSTERTEERSQFWQKLVPWGSDESEQGK